MFVLLWISLLTSSLVIVDALPGLRQLKRRDDPSIQASGPLDHTWIGSFASIGDSIAAGLGAGHSISASKGVSIPWPGKCGINADQRKPSSWSSTVIAINFRMDIRTS